NNLQLRGRPLLHLALRQFVRLLDHWRRRGPPEIEARCRREIAGRCLIFLANVPVARGQDNRFVRSSQARVDRCGRRPVVQSQRAHSSTVEAPCRRERVLGRAPRVVRECCRRCRRNCRQKRSPESRFMRAKLRRASVLSLISGKWRASASSTDRKSTRLNSSHVAISYAVFCLKKKTKKKRI